MTAQFFIMTCQISQDLFLSGHSLSHFIFVFLCALFKVWIWLNLILAKFFKNTCLKFGNHYYAVFASDITSSYYFFNYIFFLHFHKEEFCTFIWTIIGVTPEVHQSGSFFPNLCYCSRCSFVVANILFQIMQKKVTHS